MEAKTQRVGLGHPSSEIVCVSEVCNAVMRVQGRIGKTCWGRPLCHSVTSTVRARDQSPHLWVKLIHSSMKRLVDSTPRESLPQCSSPAEQKSLKMSRRSTAVMSQWRCSLICKSDHVLSAHSRALQKDSLHEHSMYTLSTARLVVCIHWAACCSKHTCKTAERRVETLHRGKGGLRWEAPL